MSYCYTNVRVKGLLSRRRRAAAHLPPFEEVLRGSVFVRRVRCGKASCHCAQGEGHTATYLSVTFPGGRTEQISLPAELVPLARRWVANYQAWWNAIERVSSVNRELLRRRFAPPAASASRRPRRRS